MWGCYAVKDFYVNLMSASRWGVILMKLGSPVWTEVTLRSCSQLREHPSGQVLGVRKSLDELPIKFMTTTQLMKDRAW